MNKALELCSMKTPCNAHAYEDQEVNRKDFPMYEGLLKYFPNALLMVSHVSLLGNRQHHADKPLHWDKNKSNDHKDALMRHLIQSGQYDQDGVLHDAKVAWRALANLETLLTSKNN